MLWQGAFRHGQAGGARNGKVRPGEVGLGLAGMDWLGWVWSDMAWQCRRGLFRLVGVGRDTAGKRGGSPLPSSQWKGDEYNHGHCL